jgi:hypothetical protein
MEIRVRDDKLGGMVVSAWLHGQWRELRFENSDMESEVSFLWKGESVVVKNKESIAEINYLLQEAFDKSGDDQRYLLPLIDGLFRVAMDEGYFDHLDDEMIGEMERLFGYDRTWFTCYGFLALELPLEIMELLVPPVMIGLDLPQNSRN